jgi:ABC-2 type transport system ATP-binding protein
MSIIMSSHLLSEIERVCDYLVVIDGGRLMQADSIATFTAATEVLSVEVDRSSELLAERLRARGFDVSVNGRLLYITMDGAAPYDAVRDDVADLGIGLVRLEQRRHRLEDLFRDEGPGQQ